MMSQQLIPDKAADLGVSRHAEDVIRKMILDGQMRPGERLNEVALSEMLDISRGPVREAIQRLSTEGLVEQRRRKGAFVRTFTPGEFVHLYECRAAIQLHAVRLAAQRASQDSLEELVKLLTETKREMGSGYAAAYPVELDFHKRIVELSENPFLVKMNQDNDGQIALARSRSGADPTRARKAFEEHRSILGGIQERNVQAAAEAMASHLDSSMKNALAILELNSHSG
jgi:DNA-binding GntR family transcriptional regulator